MNNEMDDFASPGRPNYFGLAPSPLNYPAPGKRPLSSMSPTLVFFQGKIRLVHGASGGPKIITAVLQVGGAAARWSVVEGGTSETSLKKSGGSGRARWLSGGDPPNPPCGRRGSESEAAWE
jgi:hypothetical protein